MYRGYGGNADMTTMNAISRIGATAGSAVASLGAFPAFDAMRQALPMVQSILLMAVYIMLPMILAFAAYEFSTLITLTFVVFALNFLTFWWELARWLDSLDDNGAVWFRYTFESEYDGAAEHVGRYHHEPGDGDDVYCVASSVAGGIMSQ